MSREPVEHQILAMRPVAAGAFRTSVVSPPLTRLFVPAPA